ncbi:acyl carrier protein phosphodiesterase [Salegentibacter salarius]|uniref:ACP phosphodiesterase n=1 Tax=Salegentibacter salarius TaxID=435906 RepID=A0A2N0U5C7_9FLAO|nr:acyl carrier protein phosphodiesterase [Salegentibacter salarius]OEY73985.1 ACP phosphodiesterase [Salegentibacter salarius]PKD22185.1 ACP phosphodiesterase [Salegentibacter salarius]SLJ86250.1 Acyl carrier protein phosphodiesterase [Salegentibacter salarius]
MNFLAHIYLSGDNDELKIGNFIADSIKGNQYLEYPPEIQKGIVLHRAIDTFTDTHPIVSKSVARLFDRYGHYSRVIVDILYDHFLAANWKDYSDIPLKIYTEDFYKLLQDNFEVLPKPVQNFLPYMIADNWLFNYRKIDGIEKILFQMNRRIKYRAKMHLAVEELREFYDEFENEFRMFFEELRSYVKLEIKP